MPPLEGRTGRFVINIHWRSDLASWGDVIGEDFSLYRWLHVQCQQGGDNKTRAERRRSGIASLYPNGRKNLNFFASYWRRYRRTRGSASSDTYLPLSSCSLLAYLIGTRCLRLGGDCVFRSLPVESFNHRLHGFIKFLLAVVMLIVFCYWREFLSLIW